ncbi:MAG: polyribonucleotide nucleotidyltransferase [Candidatus Brocadiia bacterium]
MQPFKVTTELGDKKFIIETGHLAQLANGSALITYGDSVVLATVVIGEPRESNGFGDDDMLPLTVDYREKTSAAGKIPGGFFKREGRPSTKEILTMRMIDRPVRPLFPKGFKQEILIMTMVLSADKNNDPDILAMNGASMALCLANVGFKGPIGAVRVGYVNKQFVLNPSYDEIKTGSMELVISGSADSVMMVEGFAKEIPEETLIEAILFGHEYIKKLVAGQNEILKQMNIKPRKIAEEKPDESLEKLAKSIRKESYSDLEKSILIKAKQERRDAIKKLKESVKERYLKDVAEDEKDKLSSQISTVFKQMEHEIVRSLALDGKRMDGRGLKDIRPISGMVGFLPRTHGSSLFTRGETQALVNVTLGTADDAQTIEGLEEEYEKRFMLHYNFPPFSTGEVKRLSGPGRREIGHGNLAEHAIEPMLPEFTEFPYIIRIVSDILQSNGSSSMATVCGSSLCLMDAGVPLKKPVSGIAMGLISESDKIAILSDILGNEDKHGDMDFKVAGTKDGITAVQMDIKIHGLTPDIMTRALAQAKEGRMHILGRMQEIIAQPRADIAESAPRVLKIKIDPEKIGMVIGPAGKHIKKLEADTKAKVEIEQDGTILIYADNLVMAEAARTIIANMTAEPEIGKIYDGTVTGIKDFGAFVEIIPGRDGMVHISELSHGFVKSVSDVLKMGDKIQVKLISIDDTGRIKLSRKELLPPPEPGSEQSEAPQSPSGGGFRPRSGGGGFRR